jgi:uncharacterized membrane protein
MLQDRAGLFTGLGVGVGLMYWLDPERGRRRRARLRDRVVHAAHAGADAAGMTARDVAHRASGTVASVSGLVRRDSVDDQVLSDRVRAVLGRVVSHPRAIEVEAAAGCVTLRGPILKAEVRPLLKAVQRVKGVKDVVPALEEHDHAGNVPALQGGHTPTGVQPDILQRRWSPATRCVTSTAGLGLAAYGVSRRDLPGTLLAATGAALIARAATNLEARRLVGIGSGRRSIDIQKTITIDAPVELVFAFWTDYSNFPRFLSRVLDVRPSIRTGQSHWTVSGPAGVPVEFDAEVSAWVPNEIFGWRTIKGSPVRHAGFVRFEPTLDDRTRVHVHMSYNPPGGWVGHGLATAFGVDPKTSLDADLVRMKTLLETGRVAHDAAQPIGSRPQA